MQGETKHRENCCVRLCYGSAAQDNVVASAGGSVTGFCALNAEDGYSAVQQSSALGKFCKGSIPQGRLLGAGTRLATAVVCAGDGFYDTPL